MGKHSQSIDAAVLERFRSQGHGWVFCPSDFLDLGSRAAVDQALSRNSRSGLIRKVARGLYDLPRRHRIWGEIKSSPDSVVEALMRRDGIEAKPSHAARSTPEATGRDASERIYLTDGSSRRMVLGGRAIRFKHVSARSLASAGTLMGDMIEALRRMGRGNVDGPRLASMVGGLSADQKARLRQDMRLAPAWIADAIRKTLPMDSR